MKGAISPNFKIVYVKYRYKSKESSNYKKQLIRSSSSCLIGEFLSIHGIKITWTIVPKDHM